MPVKIKYTYSTPIREVAATCVETPRDSIRASSFDEDSAYFSIGRDDHQDSYNDVVLSRKDAIKFCRTVIAALGCDDANE